MKRTYPFPGDSPTAQARRVAHAYRAALESFVPHECSRLDERFAGWGLDWVVPRVITHDPDEWLSPSDAANVAGISVDSLRQLRNRRRITGRRGKKGWEYRVADLWKLSAAPRGRGRSVTDTLHTSGTTVPTDAPRDGS